MRQKSAEKFESHPVRIMRKVVQHTMWNKNRRHHISTDGWR